MTRIIRTESGDYRKPSLGQTAIGVMAGGTVAGIVQTVPQKKVPTLIKNMKAQNSAEAAGYLRKATKDALEISGLKSAGVKVIDVKNTKSVNRFKKAILDCFPKNLKKRLGNVYDLAAGAAADTVKQGDNAFFAFKTNTIGVNMEKLGTATFHEMGHAMNQNFSKIGRFLQKMRTPAMAAGMLIPLIGILKRKKADGEKPKGIIDKTTTFIKNNVGKLTTLAFVPIVAEELMATAKGNKLAKKVLSPEMFKKVVKTNKFGAASYIGMAAAAGLAAWAGSKIRDAIASPKQVA